MRDITQLHPIARAKALELVDLCSRNGLKIKITECVRTVAEQDALYAQGRTTAGSIVTNANGSSYSSMHQWAVAFDICRNDGKGAFKDSDGFFSKVGKLGQSIGLEWGGAWKSITDKPHFQLPDWGSTTAKLKSSYRTPEDFKKVWPNWNVKAKVTCQKATLIRETPDGNITKYADLSKTLQGKTTKLTNGNAQFKKGETFTISEIAFCNTGNIYGATKGGKWICLYNGEKRFI